MLDNALLAIGVLLSIVLFWFFGYITIKVFVSAYWKSYFETRIEAFKKFTTLKKEEIIKSKEESK